jgi:hypothetical protein
MAHGVFGAWVFFWQQADTFWGTWSPSSKASCGQHSWFTRASALGK